MNLVTGYEGFIGSRLFWSLGTNVVGIDRDWLGLHVKYDTVFHLASRVGMGESQYRIYDYCKDNVMFTAELLEDLSSNPPAHMVLASSVSAMHGGSPYAATKACQEDLCAAWAERHGVTLSILRLYNVYGPGQSLTNPYTGVAAIFAQRLLSGLPPLVFEDGLQVRDFVHVDDVVRAMRLAARVRFNGIAEIGTGRPTPIIDVAKALHAELGGPEPIITGDKRRGDFRHGVADLAAAEQFGWMPEIMFEDGIADLATSLRGQHAESTIDAVAELREHGGFE